MRLTIFSTLLCLCVATSGAFAQKQPASSSSSLASSTPKQPVYRVVTASEAKLMLSLDTAMIKLDVRTKDEFNSPAGHLKDAILIPVQELDRRWKELLPYKKRRIMVYCCMCPRSAEASEILTKKGFTVTKMDGGIDAWNTEKFPTVVEKTAAGGTYAPASCSTKKH